MRVAGMILVAVMGLAAIVGPEPRPAETGPPAGREPAPVAVCALQEGSGRSTRVAVLSTVDGPGALSPFAGGVVTATEEFSTGSSGSEVIEVIDVAAVGTVGSLIDLPVASSAVGTLVTGAGSLAADLCAAAPEPQIFISGGSTISGLEFELHLMNPYAGEALVNLTARSEVGLEASDRLGSLVVPPRSSVVLDFNQFLSGREELAVTIDTEQGNVMAVGRQRKEGESAVWSAVPAGQDWFVPVPAGGDVKRLLIGTPSSVEVDYQIDVYGPEGVEEALQEGTVEPRGQVMVDLASMTEEAIGIRVISTGPVVPTLWIDSEAGLAATSGLPQPAGIWLLPAAGAIEGGTARLVLLNPDIEDATVTARPLGAEGPSLEVELPAGGVAEVELGAAHGYLVESTVPTVALWFGQSEGAAALAPGMPVSDG